MWYYLPEWFKWFKGRPKPSPQEEALSEIIQRRALEQNAIIERKKEEEEEAKKVEAIQTGKVAEKDFFE
jgi:hypothetical protein